MNKSIRWKQRFQNYQQAFINLEDATKLNQYSKLEQAAFIQTFEFCFELAWKTLKDFLESEGIIAVSPREVIKESFKANFIIDGHTWIDALEKRNLLTHTYSEEMSTQAVELIKDKYFPIMKQFKENFEKRL
jgi:nucleotidyltransferase substrate binding protein (TIGR01987 family)